MERRGAIQGYFKPVVFILGIVAEQDGGAGIAARHPIVEDVFVVVGDENIQIAIVLSKSNRMTPLPWPLLAAPANPATSSKVPSPRFENSREGCSSNSRGSPAAGFWTQPFTW